MVGQYQLFITLGILLAYLTNYGTRDYSTSASWRVPIALGFAWALILGVGIQFMPESPRWLLHNNRPEQARRSVALVRGAKLGDGNPWVEAEYQEIVDGVREEQKQEQAGWLACFEVKNKTLYRTLLGIALQSGQQLVSWVAPRPTDCLL